eukprot:5750056-Amphidinium_carterae.1
MVCLSAHCALHEVCFSKCPLTNCGHTGQRCRTIIIACGSQSCNSKQGKDTGQHSAEESARSNAVCASGSPREARTKPLWRVCDEQGEPLLLSEIRTQ